MFIILYDFVIFQISVPQDFQPDNFKHLLSFAKGLLRLVCKLSSSSSIASSLNMNRVRARIFSDLERGKKHLELHLVNKIEYLNNSYFESFNFHIVKTLFEQMHWPDNVCFFHDFFSVAIQYVLLFSKKSFFSWKYPTLIHGFVLCLLCRCTVVLYILTL